MTAFEDVVWARSTWILYGGVLALVLEYIFWSFVGTFVSGPSTGASARSSSGPCSTHC